MRRRCRGGLPAATARCWRRTGCGWRRSATSPTWSRSLHPTRAQHVIWLGVGCWAADKTRGSPWQLHDLYAARSVTPSPSGRCWADGSAVQFRPTTPPNPLPLGEGQTAATCVPHCREPHPCPSSACSPHDLGRSRRPRRPGHFRPCWPSCAASCGRCWASAPGSAPSPPPSGACRCCGRSFTQWMHGSPWIDPVAFVAIFIVVADRADAGRPPDRPDRAQLAARRPRPHAGAGIRPRPGCGAGHPCLYRGGDGGAGRSVADAGAAGPLCCRRPIIGARWAVHQLPADYRPRLYAPPPGRETTAAGAVAAPRRKARPSDPPRAIRRRGTRRHRRMDHARCCRPTAASDDDKLHEECGVFGVWNVPDAAARHRARPARAAAPRPGSHRHRQLRRRPLPLAPRPGPGRRQFQRRRG